MEWPLASLDAIPVMSGMLVLTAIPWLVAEIRFLHERCRHAENALRSVSLHSEWLAAKVAKIEAEGRSGPTRYSETIKILAESGDSDSCPKCGRVLYPREICFCRATYRRREVD